MFLCGALNGLGDGYHPLYVFFPFLLCTTVIYILHEELLHLSRPRVSYQWFPEHASICLNWNDSLVGSQSEELEDELVDFWFSG